MNKLKLLAGLLTAALILSIGVNVYFGNQNLALSNQSSAETKLEMNSILSQAQVGAGSELHKIGDSLVFASQQLSTTGLEGDQARAVLSALAANSSFIIDAGTADLANNLVTVEPSTHSNAEGMNIGEQDYLNTNSQNPIRPAMTNMIPLVEGFDGVAIAAPIFNSQGVFIGSISVIFDPSILLNGTISSTIKDKPYIFSVTQLDGLALYHTDPAQQGKYLFTDPVYANYPELLAIGHRFVNENSGYGTYKFTLNSDSNQIVQKESYWTTISAYGAEWRIIMMHTIDS